MRGLEEAQRTIVLEQAASIVDRTQPRFHEEVVAEVFGEDGPATLAEVLAAAPSSNAIAACSGCTW